MKNEIKKEGVKEDQPKLKFSESGFSALPKPMENLWNIITFALHTEGQPKLKFSESAFSVLPKPMENHYFCFPY